MPFFSNHSLCTRLLLLLVFGSRPGDLTEGTLVGIGDATNMAVKPQGLTNVTEVSAQYAFTQNSDSWTSRHFSSSHVWGGETSKKHNVLSLLRRAQTSPLPDFTKTKKHGDV